MANVANSNTYFIDTAAVSLSGAITVIGVILTPTNSTNLLALGDDNSTSSYPTKLSLSSTTGISTYFDLEPIYFPNGIRVKTVTACTATLILERQGA